MFATKYFIITMMFNFWHDAMLFVSSLNKLLGPLGLYYYPEYKIKQFNYDIIIIYFKLSGTFLIVKNDYLQQYVNSSANIML